MKNLSFMPSTEICFSTNIYWTNSMLDDVLGFEETMNRLTPSLIVLIYTSKEQYNFMVLILHKIKSYQMKIPLTDIFGKNMINPRPYMLCLHY